MESVRSTELGTVQNRSGLPAGTDDQITPLANRVLGHYKAGNTQQFEKDLDFFRFITNNDECRGDVEALEVQLRQAGWKPKGEAAASTKTSFTLCSLVQRINSIVVR